MKFSMLLILVFLASCSTKRDVKQVSSNVQAERQQATDEMSNQGKPAAELAPVGSPFWNVQTQP